MPDRKKKKDNIGCVHEHVTAMAMRGQFCSVPHWSLLSELPYLWVQKLGYLP